MNDDTQPNREADTGSAQDLDLTQAQGASAQSAAKQLSLQATAPPADVPGVRVERFLGSGAFGQVWVGRDINTGRGVAVKFYLHRGGVNWSLLSREVKNLVQLSANRLVVQVLEVGWDADPPYYVMELIEGGSLEDLLVRRGRLPVVEAVELFEKICTGLNHCHGKGVLHCDVKPANILLATDNEPRLADFGQSRMSHDQTPAMGTLFYMAPEQADLDSTPDARWDVYAAGALLYRMLAGDPPHRDQTLLAQLDTADSLPGRLSRYREAIATAPDPVEKLQRRQIDRRLREILKKCLATEPTQRYSNIQQILDDLHARKVATAKRPLLLLGIVGPLLLLLATCVYGYRSINRATESATAALRDEAFGSNQFAARLAAQTLETEIERYFDLTQREANREAFRKLLSQALSDTNISESLELIGGSGSPDRAANQTEARDQLLDAAARKELVDHLTHRLNLYRQDNESGHRRQQLASMFVTDANGTIVSIAYGKTVDRESDSAGRNFAYRTYFHGGRDDLPREVSIESVKPLRETHLSSAFSSTATGVWKVAVSTPIDLDDDQATDAVFVVTINLGDFQLLQSGRGSNQVAVLLEAREGPLRGTVLQHPLMDQLRNQDINLSGLRFQVNEQLFDRLLEGGDVDNYLDPMSTAKSSLEGQIPEEEPFAAEYEGGWIAAMQPVTLPERLDEIERLDEVTGQKRRVDLLVLVQYRLAEVLGPVGQLRRSLFREGLALIFSILLVSLALWWLVRRANDTGEDDSEAVERPNQKQPPPEAIETLPVE